MTAAKRRFLACVLSPAAALAAVWLLLAVTASASPPGPAAPAAIVGPLTAITGRPAGSDTASIVLRKTADTSPQLCGTNSAISVAAGTSVTYCYTTYNTGLVTLTHHTASDNDVIVLSDTVYTLTPGAGVFFTATLPINPSGINTAIWTASNPGPIDVVSDTDTAMVTVFAALRFLPAIFR
jgi:hypothetical protein